MLESCVRGSTRSEGRAGILSRGGRENPVQRHCGGVWFAKGGIFCCQIESSVSVHSLTEKYKHPLLPQTCSRANANPARCPREIQTVPGIPKEPPECCCSWSGSEAEIQAPVWGWSRMGADRGCCSEILNKLLSTGLRVRSSGLYFCFWQTPCMSFGSFHEASSFKSLS